MFGSGGTVFGAGPAEASALRFLLSAWALLGRPVCRRRKVLEKPFWRNHVGKNILWFGLFWPTQEVCPHLLGLFGFRFVQLDCIQHESAHGD